MLRPNERDASAPRNERDASVPSEPVARLFAPERRDSAAVTDGDVGFLSLLAIDSRAAALSRAERARCLRPNERDASAPRNERDASAPSEPVARLFAPERRDSAAVTDGDVDFLSLLAIDSRAAALSRAERARRAPHAAQNERDAFAQTSSMPAAQTNSMLACARRAACSFVRA